MTFLRNDTRAFGLESKIAYIYWWKLGKSSYQIQFVPSKRTLIYANIGMLEFWIGKP